MRLRYKFWFEDEDGVLFGDGRHELLRAVKELGSLAAAARELGMGYRAAWGRIRASEERLKIKLLEPAPRGRGLVLTAAGLKLIERYQKFQTEAGRAVKGLAREIFGPGPHLGLEDDDSE